MCNDSSSFPSVLFLDFSLPVVLEFQFMSGRLNSPQILLLVLTYTDSGFELHTDLSYSRIYISVIQSKWKKTDNNYIIVYEIKEDRQRWYHSACLDRIHPASQFTVIIINSLILILHSQGWFYHIDKFPGYEELLFFLLPLQWSDVITYWWLLSLTFWQSESVLNFTLNLFYY